MRAGWVLVLCLAALGIPAEARAADAEAMSLRYDAPPGCPDAASFFGEVSARTTRVRASRSGELARVLVVHIERRDESFAGHLTIEDAQTKSSPRDVTGDSCAEVVRALGLVAALAIDPSASVTERPPPPEPNEPIAPPAPSVPAGEGSSLTAEVGAGVEASARSDVVVGARLFGEIEIGGVAVRLAAMRTFAVDREAVTGSVTLAWTTGTLAVCPFRIALGDDVTVRPCAELGAGILQAKGVGVRDAQDETRPWVDAGAHGRLSWAPARRLALEVEAGANMALLRESFRFDPNVVAYQVPVIAAFARAGVGVLFP